MSLFTRKQYKFLDKLFFNAPALQQAVQELRSTSVSAAEQSVDPTGQSAVANMAPVPEAMGYKDPEIWLQVVAQTWAVYHAETMTGKIMCRRYKLRESPETTCIMVPLSDGAYWYHRKEFLNKAGLFAALKNLKL